jgi:probable HAF family extracellular repeat protein
MSRPLLAALGLALGLTAAAHAAPRYTLELLADLPGGAVASQGMAVNAGGLVAGQSAAADGFYATQWAAPNRLAQSLGDLPGGSVSSMVYGINDAGTTVGTANGSGGLRGFRLTSGGTMLELGDLPGGSSASAALAVNNAGVAVGYSYSAASGGNQIAVIWAPGSVGVELGDLPGGSYNSEARAINHAGMVAGMGTSASGKHAFVWTAEAGMVELPNLGNGGWGQANGINEAGDVVGYSLDSGAGGSFYRAALWRNGSVLALGSGNVHSFANDINNLGEVVGSLDNRAMLWTAEQQRLDLTALVDNLPTSMLLANAMSINDAGQVTGWAVDAAGNRVGYLLTPVGTVPEPGSAALLLAGLAMAQARFHARGRKPRRAVDSSTATP